MTVGALEEGQRAYLAQAWGEAYGRSASLIVIPR